MGTEIQSIRTLYKRSLHRHRLPSKTADIMAKTALFCCIAVIALAATCTSGSRQMLQTAGGPVSPQDLTTALSKINNVTKVPDTSKAVSQVANYNQTVAALQGPAAAIVQISKDLTAPSPAPNATEELAALRAYGNQSGKQGLAPAGSRLYDAYTAITNALGFNSANYTGST